MTLQAKQSLLFIFVSFTLQLRNYLILCLKFQKFRFNFLKFLSRKTYNMYRTDMYTSLMTVSIELNDSLFDLRTN